MDARFKISTDTMARRFNQDNVALVHMKTKRTHVLNSTAADIWKMIGAGHSRGEIQSILKNQYSVNDAELSAEIDQLLTTLKTELFIELLENK
jgi:hypothetical protein